MSDPTAAEFEAMARRAGLDPADHDMAEMRRAYRRLRQLMKRLRSKDRRAGAAPLFVFDPTAGDD